MPLHTWLSVCLYHYFTLSDYYLPGSIYLSICIFLQVLFSNLPVCLSISICHSLPRCLCPFLSLYHWLYLALFAPVCLSTSPSLSRGRSDILIAPAAETQFPEPCKNSFCLSCSLSSGRADSYAFGNLACKYPSAGDQSCTLHTHRLRTDV